MRISTQTLDAIAKSQSSIAVCILTVFATLVCLVDETSAKQTLPDTTQEILIQPAVVSATANGTASIDDLSMSFDSREPNVNQESEPLPEPPSAPQSILLPQSPTPETFTETDSGTGVGSDEVILAGDGNQAIGTFATQNPFVRQPGQSPVLSPPTGTRQDIPPITQNGLRGSSGASSQINSSNSIVQPAAPSIMHTFGTPPQTSLVEQNQPTFGNRIPEQSFGTQSPSTFGNPSRQLLEPNSSSAESYSPSNAQNLGQPMQSIPRQPREFADGTQRSSNSVGFNALPVDRSNLSVDDQVQPTGYNQVPSRTSNPNELATQLLSRFEVDNAPSPLPGRPTSLLEMLRQPIPVNRRSTMVSQYWETYYDWAMFLSRAEHLSWLNSVPSPSSAAEQALLRAAKSAAGNDVLAAEIQLGKSQSRLADFIPAGQSSMPPLPSDKPLVQKYKTNYALYQQYGMMPSRLRGIDGILPKTLRLIQNRAETVQLAKTAADNAKNGLSSRQASLASVLAAAKIWRASEQDLVASVTSYNKAIADYALSITRGNQTPEKIVSMLIAKPKANNNSYPRTAQQNQSSNSQFVQPTFGQSSAAGQQAVGQSGNRNFGQTTGSSGSSQRFGQPINRPNSQSGFGSGRPLSPSRNSAVAPATAAPASAFDGSATGQSFRNSPVTQPPRTSNSQFNQFGR